MTHRIDISHWSNAKVIAWLHALKHPVADLAAERLTDQAIDIENKDMVIRQLQRAVEKLTPPDGGRT